MSEDNTAMTGTSPFNRGSLSILADVQDDIKELQKQVWQESTVADRESDFVHRAVSYIESMVGLLRTHVLVKTSESVCVERFLSMT